jgi:hypothetical protein
MTDKTVTQHLADSAALAKTIADANALVVKLQGELNIARAAFELLAPWQHQRLDIGPLYGGAYERDQKPLKGDVICALHIKRINAVLGDRA